VLAQASTQAVGALAAIGRTPLLEFPSLRPSGGARIFAKWEGANPTGSMKDRMAKAMIEAALREGKLKPGQRVVEYTGGSTGSSLAFVCAAKGHPLSIVTADCFSDEKIRTMRALGAEVEVIQTPNRQVFPGLAALFVERAQAIQKKTGAYWTNQVQNPHQLEGYEGMGLEIVEACPQMTDFVMSVGTGGCVMGNALAFRKAGKKVRVTLIEPETAAYISAGSASGSHHVEGIGVFPRPKLALVKDDLFDAAFGVPEAEGRDVARKVAKNEGLLVGTSSGLNLAGAIRVARKLPKEAAVVTVIVDTGLKYLHGDLFQ
jgi:cysteine synthase